MMQGAPTLDVLLDGLFADVPAATRAGVTIPPNPGEGAARDLLVTRIGLAPMTFQSRIIAATIAEKVGVGPVAPVLRALVADRAIDPTGRSCAMQLASQGVPAQAASLLMALPDEDRERVDDARTAMELAMQMPSYDVPASLHANLAQAPASQREALFDRIERCRAMAALPALLAWCRSLGDPSLAAMHGRMVAAIIDEAGAGTALAAEVLCRAAPVEGAGQAFARVVAGCASRPLGAAMRPPGRGRVHRIDRPDGSVEMSACIPHPERIWLVAQVQWGSDGKMVVPGVFITPGEPSFGIGGGDGGVITLSYYTTSTEECLQAMAAKVPEVEVREDAVPWGLVVALCLLDGLAPPMVFAGDA